MTARTMQADFAGVPEDLEFDTADEPISLQIALPRPSEGSAARDVSLPAPGGPTL